VAWFEHQDILNDRQQTFCCGCLDNVGTFHLRCPTKGEKCKEDAQGSFRLCTKCAFTLGSNGLPASRCRCCKAVLEPTCGLLMPEYSFLRLGVSMYENPWDTAKEFWLDFSDPLKKLPMPRKSTENITLEDPQNWPKGVRVPNECKLMRITGELTESTATLAVDHMSRGGPVLVQGNMPLERVDVSRVLRDMSDSAYALGLHDQKIELQSHVFGQSGGNNGRCLVSPQLAFNLLEKYIDADGAVKLKGYPTDIADTTLTAKEACPVAYNTTVIGYGPLMDAISKVDVMGKCMIDTPSLTGCQMFVHSANLQSDEEYPVELNTAPHTDLVPAVNFHIASKPHTKQPMWCALSQSAFEPLTRDTNGKMFALGLCDKLPGEWKCIKEVAHRLGLPYHEFEQPPGYAVLIPAAVVHSVKHPKVSASVKMAMDFMPAATFEHVEMRSKARRELALDKAMRAPRQYISRNDAVYCSPYVDECLTSSVAVGTFLHSLFTTGVHHYEPV
jgi:hypothetical protein